MFTGLNDVLDCFDGRCGSDRGSLDPDSTDISGDETDGSWRVRRYMTRKQYCLKRSHAEVELTSLIVTGLLARKKKKKYCHSPLSLWAMSTRTQKTLSKEGDTVDPKLPVLAKDSALISALECGGPYDLVERLWAQFRHTAGRIDVEVSWNRNEVLVCICYLAFFDSALLNFCFVFFDCFSMWSL